MLKTKVKASQITNLTDARYFAAWEVDYIGFQLEQGNEKYIPPTQVKAMKEWLEGPKFVGEFSFVAHAEEIISLYQQLDLDALQLGTFCSLDIVQEIAKKGIPIFKEIVWNENSSWEKLQEEYLSFRPYVSYFLIDLSINHINIKNVIPQIRELAALHPTLLDVHIDTENMLDFLKETGITGLAIKGGEEEKVGYKSFDEIDDWFECLEEI